MGADYDRDLADVFAIQSEIAKAIADQLQAKLSANEKREIERPATSNISAFDLYTRANHSSSTYLSDDSRGHLLQAADLLNHAVARDPAFFRHIVNSLWLMTRFTFMATTILPRALLWRKRQSRRRLGYVPMQLRRASRVAKFLLGISRL